MKTERRERERESKSAHIIAIFGDLIDLKCASKKWIVCIYLEPWYRTGHNEIEINRVAANKIVATAIGVGNKFMFTYE